MRKKLRVFIGLLLIAGSLGCFFYPDYYEFEVRQSVKRIEKKIQKKKDDIINQTKNEETGKDELYKEMERYNQKLIESGQNLIDIDSYEQVPHEINRLLNEEQTVGYIEIPDIEVMLPLFVGASKEHLAKGAGILSQTSMPLGGENTNCVIAAHRGWRGSPFFQYIDKIQIGSCVYLHNFWETLVYQVTEIKIIKPEEINAVLIQEKKDMLTLLSCHPYGVRRGHLRYVVYCEHMERESLDDRKSKHVENVTKTVSDIERKDTVSFYSVENKVRVVLPIVTCGLSLLILFYKRK